MNINSITTNLPNLVTTKPEHARNEPYHAQEPNPDKGQDHQKNIRHPQEQSQQHETRQTKPEKRHRHTQQKRSLLCCGQKTLCCVALVVVVVVVVRTECSRSVFVDTTARMHRIRVAEHLGVKTPGVPATHDPPSWRGLTLLMQRPDGGKEPVSSETQGIMCKFPSKVTQLKHRLCTLLHRPTVKRRGEQEENRPPDTSTTFSEKMWKSAKETD